MNFFLFKEINIISKRRNKNEYFLSIEITKYKITKELNCIFEIIGLKKMIKSIIKI